MCAGASGFKMRLSFLPTPRTEREKAVAVSSPAAAAPSGWTPKAKTRKKSFYAHMHITITLLYMDFIKLCTVLLFHL